MSKRLLDTTPPPTISSGLRLDWHDFQELDRIAKERQIPRNNLVREAIREFLSQSQAAKSNNT